MEEERQHRPDVALLTDEDRKNQGVYVRDKWGRFRLERREDWVKEVPEVWRDSLEDALDTELAQLKERDYDEVSENVERLRKELNTRDYTSCLISTSWTFSAITFVGGVIMARQTGRLGPLVAAFPLGTALDYYRGFRRCDSLYKEESLLNKIERQRAFQEQQMERARRKLAFDQE